MGMHHASAPSLSGGQTHTFGPPSSVGSTRPPDSTDRSPIRRTAIERGMVTPVFIAEESTGYAPTDPYVRRFWIPIVGPGAVADILRLTAAARCGRPLRFPLHLPTLIAEGLVARAGASEIAVRRTVPHLNAVQTKRLPPWLQLLHQRHLATRALQDV